jgi:hypothetical protein
MKTPERQKSCKQAEQALPFPLAVILRLKCGAHAVYMLQRARY